MYEECFACFLQSKDRGTLPTEAGVPVFIHIGGHVKCNLAHLLRVSRCTRGDEERTAYDACKGKLAQEQVRAFLVLADLAKGDGTWSVPTLLRSCFVARSGISAYVTHATTRQWLTVARKKGSTYAVSMAQGDGHLHQRPHHHRHHALYAGALVRP